MEHIGIDWGSEKSQICICSANGEIKRNVSIRTRMLGAYLATRPKSVVVLESGAPAFFLAEQARSAGHQAKVVHAGLSRALGVGDHGIKTDARDAAALGIASARTELRSIHVPSRKARAWKKRLTARRSLVSARTQLINSVRGILRQELIKLRSGDAGTFADRVRDALMNHEVGLDDYVELLLGQIENLTAAIKAATAKVRELANGEPICRLLMTIRGIGPITALLFMAVVDDISRFPSAPRLTSYVGLTPGERSSASKTRRTGITKAGPTELRHALGQAALCIWRDNKHPLTEWGQKIAYRRSKQIAFSAMARKLAGIMYGIWKHQKPYDASLVHTIEHSARVAMA